jgi:hypothetical protein
LPGIKVEICLFRSVQRCPFPLLPEHASQCRFSDFCALTRLGTRLLSILSHTLSPAGISYHLPRSDPPSQAALLSHPSPRPATFALCN